MRIVVQRVSRAAVEVDGDTIARIGTGILALVGISRADRGEDLEWTAKKIVELRIFNDAEGKMNRSVRDVSGEILLVSQFTLYGDCRKGRRPSYTDAAPPAEAGKLYEEFVEIVRRIHPATRSGQFQAMMEVSLVNSGPVTLIVESRREAAGRAPAGDGDTT